MTGAVWRAVALAAVAAGVIALTCPAAATAADSGRGGSDAATGAIRGRLASCSRVVAGARVSIKARSESTSTGPSGVFELSGVPAGTFDLTVETRDQPRATISGVVVVAGQVTDLQNLEVSDTMTDPEHCGVCGHKCPPDASCVYGFCTCAAGSLVCGGTCTTLADLQHCRACWNRCEAWPNIVPQCGPDDCVFRCVHGTADCDGRRITGCETRIDSDRSNCGACGRVCGQGQSCVNFRCQ